MVSAPFGGLFAGVLELQIQLQIFDLRKFLIPFVERFDVHRANIRVAFSKQFGHKMAADEPARARD